jgi:diacylglycerol kinase family enzyme
VPRAAIIVNPKNAAMPALRSAVRSAESASGWHPSRWFFTTVGESGGSLAAEALADEPEVLVVVGGDGTVRAVAETLQGSPTPMTIIPTGTGNLLARNLGLPLADLERAVTAAFDGHDRTIDLVSARLVREEGEVTEHIFLAMAGIGLDAAMAVNSDVRLKSLLGWIAYVPPIARSILSNRSFGLHPRIDFRPHRTRPAHTMIIGNCGVLTGDIVLMPGAAVDDGLLDVVILRPGRLIGWTPIGARLIMNGIVYRRGVRRRRPPRTLPSSVTAFHAQGTHFEADFDEPQLIELDGDIVDHVTSSRFELLPGRLVIRVPKE